ncbi:uncharacterized protein LOC115820692 [Chanos chanos]|uniref:Uncharacterized protein LOC115820692 n=1 Tax=Chanos chanos TaxID=29144 RepID=A0A6J2W8A6_CHACN|nr:ankyrin repeat and LEM domain-containing protein 1 [Chanos chanos]
MRSSRTNSNLESLLCKAANNADVREVQSLLSQGANPNLVQSDGVAAVHLAAGKESEKGIRCLKLLLQHGADPNLRSTEGLTSLHIAASWGCYQNLRLLLKNGGNPSLKDQDGNKPADLAEQEDNSKCAILLSEYESQSAQMENEDLPKFEYSIYSGHSNKPSFLDCSIGSQGFSMLSELANEPLSSTRRSSLLWTSRMSNRPSWSRQSDLSHLQMSATQDCDRTSDWDAPVFSSTRLSVAVDNLAAMPTLKEDVPLTDCERSAAFRPAQFDPSSGPSRRASRKSVSFRDFDEYFPIPSPHSPSQTQHQPQLTADKDSSCWGDSSIDFSLYPDFLDSQRLATVLHHQGIDVTSPDHVFVFSRDEESSPEDFEKTVVGFLTLDNGSDDVFDDQGNEVKGLTQALCSSSSSGSSKYSSCDSDQYKTAIEVSAHQKDLLPSEESEETEEPLVNEHDKDPSLERYDGTNPTTHGNDRGGLFSNIHCGERNEVMTTPAVAADLAAKHSVEVTEMISNLTLTPRACHDRAEEETSVGSSKVPEILGAKSHYVEETPKSATFSTAQVEQNEDDVLLTPSPFVTGRTRSRLSRCSQRMSKSSTSFSSSSSLFEQTLPTPTRVRRNAVRTPENVDGRRTPSERCFTPSLEDSTTGGTYDSQTSTLKSSYGSYDQGSQADTVLVSGSMADTVIISGSVTETDSGSLAETLGKGSLGTPNPCHRRELSDRDREFLTSDVTTSESGDTEGPTKAGLQRADCYSSSSGENDRWISSESSSQGNLDSPITGFDTPTPHDRPAETPESGYSRRYSMSRLSGRHRPRSLANLSYTPGGRPLITDVDEPVEYLYTDIEKGHELIETHVPPTSNTSLSSTTSEDTVLYDWRSAQTSPVKGKENKKPSEEDDRVETGGLTDKELRRRLIEVGEEPGPINSHTRPIYIQRLRRLQNATTKQQPAQAGTSPFTGYSPELCRALQTFELPDCKAEEFALSEQFDQPDQNKRWREGLIKSSFNYLLLDPRVTKNLPFRGQAMTMKECFQTFVGSIFYVGKGKRSRPYSHLYEALEYFRGDKTSKKLCSKVQHILQVWNADQGVISLHCFQNVIPVEAYTREACMVDAIGLKMLTNQKRGDYYGVVSTLPAKRRRELGVHLLYRAMQIFLAEGERQLRPADLRMGH